MSPKHPSQLQRIYPAPTIVVGVGRLGLAVLERLAEDWQRLRVSSDDPSVANLRLLHVRASAQVPESSWRQGERHFVDIARYTGDGDLPSLALDFVILRSLGLIRYRNGTYQVALPQDRGLVERTQGHIVRRRYFDWLSLHPDPITSIERLGILCEKQPQLSLFVQPMINRVRQGHSPRILLRCIGRIRALSQGRDPSPWLWFMKALGQTMVAKHQGLDRVHFKESWVTKDDLRGLLEGFAPEPVPGWTAWLRTHQQGWAHAAAPSQMPFEETGLFDLCLPKVFWPQPRDLPSPLDPESLLRVDWESNGWATEGRHAQVEFTPVEASPYRLGLFDHDASSRIHGQDATEFAGRLKELGLHAHRGLVRLWVDLQRNHVEDQRLDLSEGRQKDGVEETLRQTLEVLGELIVRPLLGTGEGGEGEEEAFPTLEFDRTTSASTLGVEPSDFLSELEFESALPGDRAKNALGRRLQALGFRPSDLLLGPHEHRLLRSVELVPEDLDGDDIRGPRPRRLGKPEGDNGLLAFRHILNAETRKLFHFEHLARTRLTPTRRPPRLTIYVVGDMGEVFARQVVRPILREIHAELLRAYAPLFESFREGFDRSLCVLPLLWMPHPSDAFGGMHPLENRCEEAAIIEAVQGIRRWVETVPRGTRCVPQVIINSRVTDNAVLSLQDAVTQTRDFITFQIRNDLSKQHWLRRTVIGSSGDDFFASFACHEIEFPAERAREYLANKFARQMIAQIKRGEPRALPQIEEDAIEPPDLDGLLRDSTSRTRKRTHQASEATGAIVEEQLNLGIKTTPRQLSGAFDEDFERELLGQVHTQWRALTRDRGEMDEMMNALRRETSDHLNQTLGLVQRLGDELIDAHAAHGGLKASQAGFQQLESIAREQLLLSEQNRQRSEEMCERHKIPQTSPIGQAREEVLQAGAQKPEYRAMLGGLVIWGLMVPGLGAPMCYLIAHLAKLYQHPGVADFVLGELGPLLGGLLLFLPVAFLLHRHMAQIVQRIDLKIQDLAQTAREVVEGSGSSMGGSPSIRSFIEARLQMAAALNARNFALRVYERIVQDTELAYRLSRSVDVQEDTLMRHAEDLGVRIQMGGVGQEYDEDISQLFGSQDQAGHDFLVGPGRLKAYYDRQFGDPRELQALLPAFIEQVGGFSDWRKHACMSNTETILRFGRELFDEIVEKPIAEQYAFEEDLAQSLQQFVARHYANMGFGAKFSGYEGLDPDGVQVLCDTALILHPAMKFVFDEVRHRPDGYNFTETLRIMETPILPNSAYMLSFAQGIRPHSLRNLTRFESFHDRLTLPDDRVFPLSGDQESQEDHAHALNHLTGFEPLRDSINAHLFKASQARGHLPAQALPPAGGAVHLATSEGGEG